MVGGGLLDYSPRTERRYVVQVRINEPAVEILLPALSAAFTPSWQRAEQVKITDDQITGNLRTTIFSKSTFTIDRRSGVISTSGGYTGVCRKVEGQAF